MDIKNTLSQLASSVIGSGSELNIGGSVNAEKGNLFNQIEASITGGINDTLGKIKPPAIKTAVSVEPKTIAMIAGLLLLVIIGFTHKK